MVTVFGVVHGFTLGSSGVNVVTVFGVVHGFTLGSSGINVVTVFGVVSCRSLFVIECLSIVLPCWHLQAILTF